MIPFARTVDPAFRPVLILVKLCFLIKATRTAVTRTTTSFRSSPATSSVECRRFADSAVCHLTGGARLPVSHRIHWRRACLTMTDGGCRTEAIDSGKVHCVWPLRIQFAGVYLSVIDCWPTFGGTSAERQFAERRVHNDHVSRGQRHKYRLARSRLLTASGDGWLRYGKEPADSEMLSSRLQHMSTNLYCVRFVINARVPLTGLPTAWQDYIGAFPPGCLFFNSVICIRTGDTAYRWRATGKSMSRSRFSLHYSVLMRSINRTLSDTNFPSEACIHRFCVKNWLITLHIWRWPIWL